MGGCQTIVSFILSLHISLVLSSILTPSSSLSPLILFALFCSQAVLSKNKLCSEVLNQQLQLAV